MTSGHRVLLATMLLAACAGVAYGDEPTAQVRDGPLQLAEMPGASVYRIGVPLELAGGRTLRFQEIAGRPAVVTMFYSSCTVVCPMLTLAMQRIEAALAPALRDRVAFVMVSLDDRRDTPAALAEFAAAHHIDASRWIVAHAAAGDVRTLAAVLGIRYRRLPDGSYSHSSVITLLDSVGVPLAHTQDLTGSDPDFLEALRASLP